MFKDPSASGFFIKQEKQKKPSREEKALVKMIREKCCQDMVNALLKEYEGKLPRDQEVEEALDLFVNNLRRSGQLQGMLDDYLREKIAAERAQFGLAASK